ncbi:MAG TPA: hypothetical protein VN718_06665 [Rhizomicrobium sp.]|nr:hypothetical protein [Rhizomicrobium sp.]
MAKAKKSKAKKSKAKKSKAKKTRKPVRRAAAASRGQAKKTKAKKSKAKKARKAAPRKAAKTKTKAKKAAPKKKQQIVGEGDYQASRSFLKDQSGFVKRHASEIPAMGKDAEAALEGPQGGQLRAAEDEARSHSKASGE